MGVVPAAGYARRLGTPSGSKELLPVYSRPEANGDAAAPVCLCLLDAMRSAGVRDAYVVSRPGKEDIRNRLGDGAALDMRIRYRDIVGSRGPAETIDHAFGDVRGAIVALGFPDVLFAPQQAFSALLSRLDETGAAVVLGLFPTRAGGLDRVHVDGTGYVTRLELDPPSGDEYDTWCLAVWTPGFTELLHRWVARPTEGRGELTIGKVVEAALGEGLRIDAVRPEGAWFIDVGSPAGLQLARARLPGR